jgi:hypothetical protein
LANSERNLRTVVEQERPDELAPSPLRAAGVRTTTTTTDDDDGYDDESTHVDSSASSSTTDVPQSASKVRRRRDATPALATAMARDADPRALPPSHLVPSASASEDDAHQVPPPLPPALSDVDAHAHRPHKRAASSGASGDKHNTMPRLGEAPNAAAAAAAASPRAAHATTHWTHARVAITSSPKRLALSGDRAASTSALGQSASTTTASTASTASTSTTAAPTASAASTTAITMPANTLFASDAGVGAAPAPALTGSSESAKTVDYAAAVKAAMSRSSPARVVRGGVGRVRTSSRAAQLPPMVCWCALRVLPF